MVLVRTEDEAGDTAELRPVLVPAPQAMRLLVAGKLGSKLVSLALTAAAVHREQTQTEPGEAPQ